MEHTLRRVYCGPSCIISSLGISTAENYKNVNSYMTNISEFADGTPVAFIDKARLDFSGLDELTFAEKLSVIALQDIEDKAI